MELFEQVFWQKPARNRGDQMKISLMGVCTGLQKNVDAHSREEGVLGRLDLVAPILPAGMG